MANYVLIDEEIPVAYLDVTDIASALARGLSRIFIGFTVEGLTFYVSDQGFNLDYMGGKPRVYPVVVNWGAFRKFMSQDGRDRDSEIDIEFDPQGVIVDSGGTTKRTWMELLQRFQMREVAVSFYQYSEIATTDFLLWTGFWQNVHSFRTVNGKPLISVRFGSKETDLQDPISDVVTPTSMPAAPVDSSGKMVPRAYGKFSSIVHPSADTAPIGALFGGYGHRFVEGVVVDEQQTTLKTKVRFAKDDGSQAAFSMLSNLSFCAYIPEANCFAIIDDTSLTMTNDATEVAILVSLTPNMFIGHKLGPKGTKMKAAFDPTSWKVIDGDPTNYIETTSTDYEISFTIPSLSISGLRVSTVYPFIHATCPTVSPTTRVLELGIWDPFNTGAAGWLGNAGRRQTGLTLHSTQSYIGLSNTGYTAQHFKSHVGVSTVADFAQGKFITRDSNDEEQPLEVYVNVTSASKDQVRIHALGLVVYGTLGLDKQARVSRGKKRIRQFDVQGRFVGWKEIDETITEFVDAASQRQLSYLCQGTFQKDTGTTYQGGSAGDAIRNGAGIAHHLLEKIGGESINNAAGTLGNFADAKTEETAGEKAIDPVFGPDVVTLEAAVAELQARHPIRLHKEDGVWQCVYEEMNPHSSRFYRSTSSIVRISEKQHLVGDSVKVDELPWDRIRNEATVNFGHSFGANRALGSVNIINALSQELFGVRRIPQPIEESWITAESLDPSVTNLPARFLGQYYTRTNGRPRLTVTCRLSQEFFDLKRGHVVEFDTDMEDAGILCTAYRCGYLDYAYGRDDVSVVNGALSTAHTIIPTTSGITNQTYFLVSQQLAGLNVVIGSSAGYTTIANSWQYWNGTAWTNLTATATRNGSSISADAAFTVAGTIAVAWDRPSPELVKKAEFSFAGFTRGPCYGYRHKYTTNAIGGAITSGPVTYPAKWYGRLFEAIEVTRKPGSEGDYPYVEAVFQEVM